MNLLCVIVVLAATGVGLATLALRISLHSLLHRLRHYAPASRVRWLVALLGVAPATGLLAVLVGFGPCIHNLLAGLSDTCRTHGGPDFFFCFRTPMHDVPAAWLLTGVLSAFVLVKLGTDGVALVRANLALGQLRSLGRYDVEQRIWVVPGNLAILSGWPRSTVYLGQTLADGLSKASLGALLAHERAHQQRGDLGLKLFAQLLAACVPSFVARPMLDELELAMEQACDALAAEAVDDPLLVARSLLDVAGRAGAADGLALAFCSGEDHLEARVRALCEPHWRSSARPAVATLAFALGFVASCAVFVPRLHDLTEAVFERFLG